MSYNKPKAEPIITTDICNYGCGNVAKYIFANKKLCCAVHQNSCEGKRKAFSESGNHALNAKKSLETRTALGITKSSQIKGAETRRNSGHYKKLAKKMQEHWATHPWQNSLECPVLSFKGSLLTYQGSYELQFLEDLEIEHGFEWVIANVKRGPIIKYVDPTDNTERIYISDFIIGDTIYEIKSSWTWNKKGRDVILEEKNKEKLTACVDQGYNVVLVLNKEKIVWQSPNFG